MKLANVAKFFAYARERHTITLKRARGELAPWTKNKILQQYRFCSVFRENDKTTAWFREHVRDPLRDKPEVLLATVVFRMLNRIETGQAMFCQTDMDGTAFERFLKTGDARHLKRDIIALIGERGPYVTGAYIITSPPGFSKLDGMMQILQNFYRDSGWFGYAEALLDPKIGALKLQDVHYWFSRQPWFGNFHSYEIVTDLRHTKLLENAPDIREWAQPGPGARRGLNRIAGRDKSDKSLKTDGMIAEMQKLLIYAQDTTYWPQVCGNRCWMTRGNTILDFDAGEWPVWEMRDVEHTLCEFDKYERTRLGEGRPRGKFSL